MVFPRFTKTNGSESRKGKTMTKRKYSISGAELKRTLEGDGDFLKPLVQLVVQEILEAEMEEALGAAKGERTEERRGNRSGY